MQLMQDEPTANAVTPEYVHPPSHDYIQGVARQRDVKCLTDHGTQLTALKPVKYFNKGEYLWALRSFQILKLKVAADVLYFLA